MLQINNGDSLLWTIRFDFRICAQVGLKIKHVTVVEGKKRENKNE